MKKILIPMLGGLALTAVGCGKQEAPVDSESAPATAAETAPVAAQTAPITPAATPEEHAAAAEVAAKAVPDAATPTATAAPAVSTAAGEQIFKRCAACHTITKDGSNGVGPNLFAVVGRSVAAHAGFSYSAAMKAKGGTWTKAALDTYLKQPMTAVPGTKMMFAGVADDADRAALIAYLAAQK